MPTKLMNLFEVIMNRTPELTCYDLSRFCLHLKTESALCLLTAGEILVIALTSAAGSLTLRRAMNRFMKLYYDLYLSKHYACGTVVTCPIV